MLVGVGHLTGWPIAWAITSSTATVVLEFIRTQIIDPFGFPRVIISESAIFSMGSAVQLVGKGRWIEVRTSMAYLLMSNGRAERVVGTIKHSNIVARE